MAAYLMSSLQAMTTSLTKGRQQRLLERLQRGMVHAETRRARRGESKPVFVRVLRGSAVFCDADDEQRHREDQAYGRWQMT